MSSPRFSIIITSYNQQEFIRDAVDSALPQHSGRAEIIIVDDGSTDGSQEVLRQYGDAIRLVCSETNRGAGAARNCGAALASSEYLVFLDGDDAFLPWALDVYERIVLERNPKMILGTLRSFQGMLPLVQPGGIPREMHIAEYQDYLRKDRRFWPSASAQVVDRQSFQDARGWSEEIWPLEDQDLLLRLGNCGRTVQILAPATVFRRTHAANAVRIVAPFIPALGKIIRNERAGEYPGGERRRRERRAILGGPVVFWAIRAAKARLYGAALKLLISGWPMIWAKLIYQLRLVLEGRQPYETVKM